MVTLSSDLQEHEELLVRGMLAGMKTAELAQLLNKPPVWVLLVTRAVFHKTGCPDRQHLEAWARHHRYRPWTPPR